jgi:hypothetical protein
MTNAKHPMDAKRDVDLDLINKIADRALYLYAKNEIRVERTDIVMDLTACHFQARKLDLVGLLGADDLNFVHDVAGINRHLDRENYTLQNCFTPRFSAKTAA